MFRTYEASRGFRTVVVGLIAGIAALAVAVDSADARGKKKRHSAKAHSSKTHHAKKGGGYNPPYSAIVVDANSGAVLHSAEADGIRHPASLTKIMTLYMLFERLEAGKLKLETPLKVSAHAASQSPTKLGLKDGQTITADEAIRGLVTRSANDAAVVIAEAIAGDEDDFAKMMTRKARALGMTRTVYKNASGLPDRDQVTTARDQAQLGRAIQDRFPKYYRYFSTPSFTFRGKAIRNHNNLLGSVPGVDGIKTGYTQASGFNLVTSIKRNNHYLVAVVLGGSSGAARDARMRSLVEKHVNDGATRRTAALITEAPEGTIPVDVAAVADTPAATPTSAPAAASATASAASPATPLPAKPINAVVRAEPTTTATVPTGKHTSEPIKPIAVKTIKVKLTGVQTAALTPPLAHLPVVPVKGEIVPATAAAPAPVGQPEAPKAQAAAPVKPVQTAAVVAPAPIPAAPAPALAAPPQAAPAPAPADPAPKAAAAPAPAAATAVAVVAPAPARAAIQVASAEPDSIPVAAIAPASEPAPTKIVHTGWMIQVGAFDAEREAKDRLSSAQSKAKHLLARAEPYTETVVKDNKTFFRARFAGFQKDEAEAACKYLKRNDFACMTLKN